MAYELYERSLPYFLLRGRVASSVPYTADFDILSERLVDFGIKQRDYLEAVFTRTWGEEQYPIIITPRSLRSPWAMHKYIDWKSNPDPVEMEKAFIKRTKSIDIDFSSHGAITPKLLDDIRRRNVSLTYLVSLPSFWRMYKSLDKDIQEEYFCKDRLYYLRDMMYKNPEIIGVISGK